MKPSTALRGIKSSLFVSIFVSIFILTCFCTIGSAQRGDKKGQTFIVLRDNKQEIVDLSDEVRTKCSYSVKRKVGINNLEVRFQAGFDSDANKLADVLESVIRETQTLLTPLRIDDVKIYLLQKAKVAANYKYTETWQGTRYYVHLAIFADPSELDLANCTGSPFCSHIFDALPHELTHTATGGLLSENGNRWYDDGLAEYVANIVLERFYAKELKRKIESYVPDVSYSRDEIRSKIWSWRDPSVGFLMRGDDKDINNEIFKYGASYYIVDQIVVAAKNNGTGIPLGVLHLDLLKHKEKSGRSIQPEELLSLIRKTLGVDPMTIKTLQKPQLEELGETASRIIKRKGANFDEKRHALNILAGADEINLTGETIDKLLDQVHRAGDGEEVLVELAATALARRIRRRGFDDALKNYLRENTSLKKPLGKIKEDLQALSLRPKPTK